MTRSCANCENWVRGTRLFTGPQDFVQDTASQTGECRMRVVPKQHGRPFARTHEADFCVADFLEKEELRLKMERSLFSTQGE